MAGSGTARLSQLTAWQGLSLRRLRPADLCPFSALNAEGTSAKEASRNAELALDKARPVAAPVEATSDMASVAGSPSLKERKSVAEERRLMRPRQHKVGVSRVCRLR